MIVESLLATPSTTPENISQNVLVLSEMIGSLISPIYLDVKPESWCQKYECFSNVKRKIELDGGSIQHGWTIWEKPEILIEGEFHAVWVDANGNLVDITPNPDGETRILFLPDNTRTYNDKPVPNIRMPLSDDPMVLNTIRRSEAWDKLREKYNINGQAHIPEEEMARFFKEEIASQNVTTNVGRNSLCPCGSNKKYKKCCGK